MPSLRFQFCGVFRGLTALRRTTFEKNAEPGGISVRARSLSLPRATQGSIADVQSATINTAVSFNPITLGDILFRESSLLHDWSAPSRERLPARTRDRAKSRCHLLLQLQSRWRYCRASRVDIWPSRPLSFFSAASVATPYDIGAHDR